MTTGRRTRQRNDVKAALRASALHLWSERGYEDVTVADICADAGATQAAFYYHFGSMSSLVVEALHDELSSDVFLDYLAMSSDPTWDVAVNLIEVAWAQFTRFRSGLLLAAVRTGLFEPAMWEGYPGLSRLVELLLRRGQGRGDVDEDIDVEVVARTIISIVLGVMLEWTMGMQDERSAQQALKDRLYWASCGVLTAQGRPASK